MKYTSRIYLCLIFGILYIPILTLILFSFNDSDSTAVFQGFTFDWYKELFSSAEAFMALRNTLVLAVLSSLLATVIGTAAAEGIYKMKNKYLKGAINSVTNIPMMNPDIVTGMSMMLFFAAVMAIFKIADYNDMGFVAMLIAHTTFCLPYVILSVLPRITELGPTLTEAALDLGCTPAKAFFKVKLPNIMSAVLSGLVMAFTLSLDDFVISYFIAPPNFQTLPLLIYSMTKKKVKPDMYALSTIIIVTIFVLLIISNLKGDKKKKGNERKRKIAAVTSLGAACVLIISIIVASFASGISSKNDTKTLNVYNWGEYISDGSEGSIDVNEEFEKYCEEKLGIKVTVNYSTYATNEDLYSKLKNSAVAYDVIIPSDYMLEKLKNEGMLHKFNVAEEIPNYKFIGDEFRGLPFDTENSYSVPYTYGMMGIIYNPEHVDQEDVEKLGWGILWSEKYKGKILQFNNPRDAFATAMYWKGLDVNSEKAEDWEAALKLLKEQKHLLQAYVNDEVFDKMNAGSAYIAPYFVGDYVTMAATEGSVPLEFHYPSQGVNYFVDAMCIPENSGNKELAKAYINFMLEKEIAIANAEYIGYASPNTLVSNDEDYKSVMEEDYFEGAIELLYGKTPAEVNDYYDNTVIGEKNASCYKDFTADIQTVVNKNWEELKLHVSTEVWVHVVTLVILVSVVTLAVYTTYIKKKRSRDYRMRDKLKKQTKA